MSDGQVTQRVKAVRGFNRFYTRQIGVLGEDYLESPFSLAEVRILYELAHRGQLTASTLAKELALDPGYLSRIVRRLRQHDLIAAEASVSDRRQRLLTLTPHGRETFAPLQDRARAAVAVLLERLSPTDQERLVGAMRTIEQILDPQPAAVPYILRPPHAGDLGWIVQRHGAVYAAEYGWNEEFEALVAGIVAKFAEQHDPRRECCWIAERNGEPVGSVMLVTHTPTVAKLRLLLVEPHARGLGIGARLVDECIRFARTAGYESMTLWTNSVLTAARRIYAKAGFQLTASEPFHGFGHDLVSETWDLAL